MAAYRICEECGAALDPGERCDCQPTTVPVRLPKTCETCGAPAEPSECRGCCGLEHVFAVVDALALPDVDISNIYLDCVGLGCIRKEVILRHGIEEAAAALRPSELVTANGPGFTKRYFTVGGVSVIQYGEERTDEKAP